MSAPAEWLLWPQAVAWLLSRDRVVVEEVGQWFRQRMTENRSASIVYAIRLSEIALDRLPLPAGEDERAQAAAAALLTIEADMLSRLERGESTARGKRTETSSPELIPSWDWADSVIEASRSFELKGAFNKEVKFYDVRIDAAGLPGWGDSQREPSNEPVTEPTPSAPWSEEEMVSAISSCSIRNRDQAWKQIFRDQRGQHQWDVRAFREIWSRARGTQGMKGRPEKIA